MHQENPKRERIDHCTGKRCNNTKTAWLDYFFTLHSNVAPYYIKGKLFHYMPRWHRGEVKVQLHPYSTLALGGVGWSLP